MKVLIAGGFGYLGARIAAHLCRQSGYHVALGTRTVRPLPQWLPTGTVSVLNWASTSTLEEACSDVDVIIHCAGMNAQECGKDPVAALEFNGVATGRLVQAAIRKGVRRFFYFSTAHVYGSPLDGSIVEEDCPRNLHPYATSHLAGEQILLAAVASGKLEGAVLRLSNAFGAPMEADTNCWMLLINDLCRQAVMHGRLTLHSSGMQLRDFITIEDVCMVLQKYLQCAAGDLPDLLNLGSGKARSVFDMASLIQQRCVTSLGFEPVLQRPSPRPGEQTGNLDFRIDRLTNSVGVLPNNDVAEIDQLLAFCKGNFSVAPIGL
ncbi:SDR family oxidoreductase [Herbaspirillum sp. NPDC101397]|uniref:SDR family oxidoreductase n=1 Tax=Herbaspirillum sp. NPDC101397 TaxID=3364006 RepID=UPI00383B3C2F